MKRLLRYVWIEAIPGAAGRPFSLLNPLRRASTQPLLTFPSVGSSSRGTPAAKCEEDAAKLHD
ncbi:hypothetical protein AB3X34_18305 [Raoultella terrigena]|jgi:hypothetical protein|uniref:hypothetical protein n=1 Tax=Raoultella terrigena TaxID=577 RepID=UPI00349F11B9